MMTSHNRPVYVDLLGRLSVDMMTMSSITTRLSTNETDMKYPP